jgi:predicted nucleotidyltransferase
VAAVAEALGVPHFVGGALARDILLFHVLGLPVGRATRDIDVMVLVEDWAAFDALKERLVRDGSFSADARMLQRLHPGPSGPPLDILPVVALPVLSILKLTAWLDRHLETGFDTELAGARLLGRDAVALCGADAVRFAVGRLPAERRRLLQGQMMRRSALAEDKGLGGRAESLFNAFWEELEAAAREPD